MMADCSALRMALVGGAALLLLMGLTNMVGGGTPHTPMQLTTSEHMLFLRLPDGMLMGNFLRTAEAVQEIAARYSKDNGLSWSEPQTLFKLATGEGQWGLSAALCDRDGEVHLFFSRSAKAGETEEVPTVRYSGWRGDRPLDIWHTKSSSGRQHWPGPRIIWQGYTGPISSAIQMSNGRIVLAFAQQTPPRSLFGGGDDAVAFTFMGPLQCTSVYSADAGETWHPSPSSLGVEVPSIQWGQGAHDPAIIQLKDGRVWMLIRTQRGRLWESFSPDGITWCEPQPTNIISSDSPAAIVRLDDGRLVLFWYNSQRFPYHLGGRHVLYAAISADEGNSWHGYREVARDPERNAASSGRSYFGNTYSSPIAVNDGKIIYCTGQGNGRVQLRLLDPEWLLETHQKSDFSAGAEEQWMTFGTRGVEFATHPQNPEARVLSIQKTQQEWPAAAVWNFPSGHEGHLQMRIMLNEGCGPVRIGLTDHFSIPFDLAAHLYNLFNIEIDSDGKLLGRTPITPSQWHDLQLDWSVNTRACRITLDGQRAGTVPLRHETAGACCLRLCSAALETAPAGFLVDSVEVNVTND